MKEQKNNLRIVKMVSCLTLIFGTLSFYSFNCAPQSFQMSNQESLLLTDGVIAPVEVVPEVDTKARVPQSLLTSEQIFESQMNLTGQKETVTNGQLQEFDRRSGSLPETTDVEKINAPMMIALASFSGETCNGLISAEADKSDENRKFFKGVNFRGPASQVTEENYKQVVASMAEAFWNRAPNNEEATLFGSFKTEYISAIAANQVTNANQTRGLFLATCAAMLSAFDTYTY